jgi:hypothetical protein
MIEIRRPSSPELGPMWPEMRRLWRQDAIRRRHLAQLEDIKRGLILDQLAIWVVWDTAPPDRGEFGGPHYCLGIVLVSQLDRQMWVQFACGRSLQKWTRQMADEITALAGLESISQLRIYCRKGWKQEFGSLWPFLKEAGIVTFHRDPERLYVDVHEAVYATA